MATPSTVNTWPLNGSVQEFDVTFDYLSQTFIKVNLVGLTGLTPLVLGTDYTFVTPKRIRTILVYGPPNFMTIELRRETSTTERLVEFQDASILHATDLNTDALQVMHVAEEARNAATETLGVNGDGNLDARYRRIVNVAEPQGPSDAITLNYYTSQVTGVHTDRLAAEDARNKAQEWAIKPTAVAGTDQSAKTYAGQASTSAGIASAQSGIASDQSGIASAQAGIATTQASNAAVFASSASGSASSASASAGTATTQAGIATTQAAIATTQAGIATSVAGGMESAIAFANTFSSVPATNQGQMIVVTQPHLRFMVWNGVKYVRAPWHMPGILFFSHAPAANVTHGIQVRADVTYNKSDYPDLAEILGVSGSTFILPEGRARVLRAADNGRGIDSDLVNGYLQGDAGRNLTGSYYMSDSGGSVAWGSSGQVGGAFASLDFAPGRSNFQTNANFVNAEYGLSLDASRQWPTASEFRVKSLTATLYITK